MCLCKMYYDVAYIPKLKTCIVLYSDPEEVDSKE